LEVRGCDISWGRRDKERLIPSRFTAIGKMVGLKEEDILAGRSLNSGDPKIDAALACRHALSDQADAILEIASTLVALDRRELDAAWHRAHARRPRPPARRAAG
jgi:hypothetical protein